MLVRRFGLAAICLIVCVPGPGGGIPSGDSYCDHPGASFGAPRRFVGVNDDLLATGSGRYRDCTTGRWGEDAVGYYRAPLGWKWVQPHPGGFDFSAYDSLVAVLASHHISFLPVLILAPRWAQRHVRPPNPGDMIPPARDSQFAAFAAAAARRYGPSGSFWSQHPLLPRVPIRDWQIWNEPNLVSYWAPRPQPGAYVRLLRAAYTAIKRIDPGADVVTAGMPFFGPSTSAVDFYRAMFRDGAIGAFDTLAFHAYAPTARASVHRMFAIRALMNGHGLGGTPLWITEFGWASGGPGSPYTARDQTDQRNKLALFLGGVERYQARLGLRGVVLWAWQDEPASESGGFDNWGLHAGVYTQGLKPKRSLSVFVAAARRLSG